MSRMRCPHGSCLALSSSSSEHPAMAMEHYSTCVPDVEFERPKSARQPSADEICAKPDPPERLESRHPWMEGGWKWQWQWAEQAEGSDGCPKPMVVAPDETSAAWLGKTDQRGGIGRPDAPREWRVAGDSLVARQSRWLSDLAGMASPRGFEPRLLP